MSIQSNIAQQVATALKTVISQEEKQELESVSTTDIRAYDLSIRGRYETEEYWRDHDTNHLAVALRLLNEALKIDPEYLYSIKWKANVFVGQRKWDSRSAFDNHVQRTRAQE